MKNARKSRSLKSCGFLCGAGARAPVGPFCHPISLVSPKEMGVRLRLEAERRFAAEVSFISRQCRERSEANARSAMWTVIHPSGWEPFDNGKFGENRLLAPFSTKASFLWSLRGFFLTRQKEISQKGFAGASPLHPAPRREAPRYASRRSLAPGSMAGHTQCGWRVSQKICPIFRDFSEKTIDNTRMF